MPAMNKAAAAQGAATGGIAVSLALGVTQTIGYGTLYYAFGVLAPAMSADTGFSLTAVYGLFSVALLAGGLAAPFAGRLLDRFDPAMVMAAGSIACAASLALWALLPGKAAFAVLLIAVEIASVLALYEAAFVVAAWLAPAGMARRTITGITFIAGFASTIFWPLTQYLGEQFDWRGTYLVYAGMHLFINLPVHLWLWRKFRNRPRVPAQSVAAMAVEEGTLPASLRRRVFPLLMAGFAANAFVIASVHLHLIGILGSLGLASSAAMTGAIIGPAQVAARVVEFASSGRTSIHVASVASAAALPLALAVLVAGAPSLPAAIFFGLVFGAGQGLSFIIRGVLPLELYGRRGYGALTGKINSVRLVVSATGPFVIAFLFEHAGVHVALEAILAAALLSAAALLAVSVMARRAAREARA
jgi:MFS family permease